MALPLLTAPDVVRGPLKKLPAAEAAVRDDDCLPQKQPSRVLVCPPPCLTYTGL